MNELIRPINTIKPAQCRVCLKPLHIVVSEQTDNVVNEMGVPIASDISYSKITGYCSYCKLKYDMVRRGINFVHNIPFFTSKKENNNNPKIIFGKIKNNPFDKN